MKTGNRIRRALAETPATAYELAAELGWAAELGERRGMRRASAWCANLLWIGEAEHAGQVVGSTGRLQWLYQLTPRGRAKLRRRP